MKVSVNYFIAKLFLNFLLMGLLPFNSIAQKVDNAIVRSPDGKLVSSVFIKKDASGTSKLYYQVDRKAEQVVLPSELGIGVWNTGIVIKNVTNSNVNRTWDPLYAERNKILDEYNQTIITLGKDGFADELQIIFRAYNEGVAFRYSFPKITEAEKFLPVKSESTQFVLPEGAKAWFQPAIESPYVFLPLKDWPGQSEGPLTVSVNNSLHVALGEAAQVNYSVLKYSVKPESASTIYCDMQSMVPDSRNGSFISPWRYVLIAEKPGQLLENNFLVLNLNAPDQLADSKWIKPGKMIRDLTLSYEGSKKLIDYAANHNIQYILLDAGWYGPEFQKKDLSDATKPKPDLNLSGILAYGKEKGVGIWLYVNRAALESQLDEILPLYQKWGVVGIKFGFVRFGTYPALTWIHDAVRKCAEHKLMVDIHDGYRPSGYARTYPNLLTQEGVRGNEQMPDANNNTTLPFTRFIAGPADYTLCYYDKRLKTTRAHQLALAAVYYSPLQTLYWYDKPYERKPGPELQFWDRIPTIWDETRVVQGEIGQHITVARRNEDKWFVGSLTNNDARDSQFTLGFLKSGKKYLATIFSEDKSSSKEREAVKVERYIVNDKSVVKMQLAAGGGQAMILELADSKNSQGVKEIQ